MTPKLPAAPLAIIASVTFVACAASQAPQAANQAMEPPPSLFGPTGKGTSPVDDQMLALMKAEDEIDKLFPNAGKEAPLGVRKKAGATADKPMDQKADKDVRPEALSGGAAPCAVACRALQSMQTSADHLCKLAGEGDGRCDDARGRVRGATARVRSVCPGCGVAAQ